MSRGSFQIRVDASSLVRGIDDNVQRQLPFIQATALNNTARQAQSALKAAMPQYFDRPTPYTLSSTRITYATKAKPVATVGYKDDSFKGTPATKYLLPEVDGGTRNVKRVESLLRGKGLLPYDMYVVPGSAAQLDRYGNFSRGQYSKILAQLQASRDRTQNETKASRARKRRNPSADARYFVGRPGGGRMPLGVWARYQFAHGYAVKPVLLFVKAPRYTARFPFDQIVADVVDVNLGANVAAAFVLAASTSR
ncbi:hypothetical protein [Paraburkholderia sp. RL17-381-BIF-C]|uniref:hypothetical protein n=1 Tax=Paraburkholderia sp. RL17-381-BIF-C TaxID=3031635 RepID=UPI0038B75912